ncbi:type II toxin-antitoxin system Phd/YefM family antitoxin [Shouchella shacheensis]|uniref:type II toxin-antitoxin system Phd/YefM family antitoxin n=1 Tax=Shouchella shacheensis TaxID=1649580 RepID=UPI00073FDC9B|nr:type II toxin-antitoxin system Phd/YefM family antitoxin [Shouchella shacheensis]
MGVDTMEKPLFTKNQIVPATTASKSFSEVRKKAVVEPQFISDHNEIKTVVIDYKDYEKLYSELNELREYVWEMKVLSRIKQSDEKVIKPVPFTTHMSDKERKEFEELDPDLIVDEDLFD